MEAIETVLIKHRHGSFAFGRQPSLRPRTSRKADQTQNDSEYDRRHRKTVLSLCRFELPIHRLVDRDKVILGAAGSLQNAVVLLLSGGLFLLGQLESNRQEHWFRRRRRHTLAQFVRTSD